MITIKNVSFKYVNTEVGALKNISLHVNKGEVLLLCGKSGCGKTTLTRLINGLIPHYYEGELTGSVHVNGLDIVHAELYETARKVGSVFQNPRSQFFCVDTTSEIAFGCENIGLDEKIIKERIHTAAKEMSIEALLGRSIFNLSGGEKQKVACASVSAMHPDIMVLDEPTSNLDMNAIKSLKHTVQLWKSQGKTVIIAEHRLHWLKEVCDRVIYMNDGKIDLDVLMRQFCQISTEKLNQLGLRSLSLEDIKNETPEFILEDTMELRDFKFSYSAEYLALDIEALILPQNSAIAVIGSNGAGKSTLSKCLCGLEKKFKGRVVLDGAKYSRRAMLKKCYMVMQDVNHQLFCESVDDEVRLGMDKDNEKDMADILEKFDIKKYADRHPLSLSGGQKQRVAIAAAILANKEILIFDEPTSGLDYCHMKETAKMLNLLLRKRTVIVVSHDPELIMNSCTHVLRLEKGKVHEFYPLDEQGSQRLMNFFINKSKEETESEKAI